MSHRGLLTALFCTATFLSACDGDSSQRAVELIGAQDDLPPLTAEQIPPKTDDMWSSLSPRRVPADAQLFEGPAGLRAGEGAQAPPQPETTPASDEQLPAPTIASIALEKAGAAPHEVLRFSSATGTQNNFKLTLQIAATMEADGNPMENPDFPPMRFDVQEKVRTNQDNHASIELSLQNFEIADGSGSPEEKEMLRMTMARMAGIQDHKFVFTRDDQGRVSAQHLHTPAGVSAQANDTYRGFLDALSRTQVVFPEQAVGLGARWTVEQESMEGGMMLVQRTTFTLLERDGDTLTLEIKVSGKPTRTVFTPAGAPPGVELHIQDLKATSQGELEIQLSQLVPSSAKVKAQLDVSMEVKQGGETMQKIHSLMATSLELHAIPGQP